VSATQCKAALKRMAARQQKSIPESTLQLLAATFGGDLRHAQLSLQVSSLAGRGDKVRCSSCYYYCCQLLLLPLPLLLSSCVRCSAGVTPDALSHHDVPARRREPLSQCPIGVFAPQVTKATSAKIRKGAKDKVLRSASDGRLDQDASTHNVAGFCGKDEFMELLHVIGRLLYAKRTSCARCLACFACSVWLTGCVYSHD
jgi:hypothetical protein